MTRSYFFFFDCLLFFFFCISLCVSIERRWESESYAWVNKWIWNRFFLVHFKIFQNPTREKKKQIAEWVIFSTVFFFCGSWDMFKNIISDFVCLGRGRSTTYQNGKEKKRNECGSDLRDFIWDNNLLKTRFILMAFKRYQKKKPKWIVFSLESQIKKRKEKKNGKQNLIYHENYLLLFASFFFIFFVFVFLFWLHKNESTT